VKTCYHCHQEKALDEFSIDRKKKDGLSHLCRACISQRNADSYRRHKTVWHERYYQRGGKEKQAARYRENPRYRQMVTRVGRARRLGRKYGVTETFTVDDFEQVFARFDNRCFNCGVCDRLQVDHHMPKHLGYPLRHDNAVILCEKCNSLKHRSLPRDFYSVDQLVQLEQRGVLSHT
jgi:5-methylcytosine-specific restriction endonuclease McrA